MPQQTQLVMLLLRLPLLYITGVIRRWRMYCTKLSSGKLFRINFQLRRTAIARTVNGALINKAIKPLNVTIYYGDRRRLKVFFQTDQRGGV